MRDVTTAAFQSRFNNPPAYLTRAPGRVNLIGEHTDYNDGFVLPMAIDRNIWIAARPRPDDRFTVHSLDYEGTVSFTTAQLKDATLPHWTHYVRGVWYLLGERGAFPPTADIAIAGDVPIGAGLSSSAAIAVALIELALALLNQPMSQPEKALLGVEVEHRFTGMPCGVMDQMTSAVSQAGHALLIDCRSLETTPVHIPAGASVVIMDTARRRQLVDSAYAERRRQCEEAARQLGVASLREATLDMAERHKTDLGDVRYRRARHVISENARTIDAVGVLQRGDLAAAGNLMNASHFSLRDDYEVSWHEADIMTDIARQQAGCYGARMMGGGFGGCAVALVDSQDAEPFMERVGKTYQAQTDLQPALYAFQPSAGSEVVLRPS
jgi:galactokinase